MEGVREMYQRYEIGQQVRIKPEYADWYRDVNGWEPFLDLSQPVTVQEVAETEVCVRQAEPMPIVSWVPRRFIDREG